MIPSRQFMNMQFAKAINFYKQYGLLEFIKRLFHQLGFIIATRSVIFLKIDLNNILTDCNEPYSFLVATADDIQEELDYKDGWFKRERALSSIQNGHRLFVLKENEKMVYFLWADLKSVQIKWLDIHFSLPEDVAYITGVYTLPEYRNRGIGYKLKKEMIQYLKKEGFNYLIEIVDPTNTTALKIDKRLGFKEYQSVHYKRYWFLKYYCVNKYNSDQQKRFFGVTGRKSQNIIWKAFL